VKSLVKEAMENLALPEFSSIRDVFGKVLAKRSTQNGPDCALFHLLARKGWPLEILNEDCRIYVEAVGVQEAQRKCHAELMGKAKRSGITDHEGTRYLRAGLQSRPATGEAVSEPQQVLPVSSRTRAWMSRQSTVQSRHWSNLECR
jgi:hypothetical protein